MRVVVLTTALAVLGACAGATEAPDKRRISPEQAAAIVNELDGLLVGRELHVLAVREEDGFYVVVNQRNGDAAPREQRVSFDGSRLFDAPRDVASERERLRNDKRFVDCLLARGVVAYVRSDMPASLTQLQMIGGAGERLAIDCALEPNNCAARGVKEVPSIGIGEEIIPGMRSRGWLETRTGCK